MKLTMIIFVLVGISYMTWINHRDNVILEYHYKMCETNDGYVPCDISRN